MSKMRQLFVSMLKIGLIGFGGGNALIPVIEKTAIDEQNLITKEDYDVDVMVASITPGALPVEISAGIGRRIMGSRGLLLGAIAMALPGVILTILLTSLMSSVNGELLKQIGFVAVGIYAFICSLLTDYISGTIKTFKGKGSIRNCVVVIIGVVILVCGKNLFRILPGDISPMLSLSTLNVFAMAFFVIFYTRCKFKPVNMIVSAVCCIIFTLCQCKAGIITNDYVRYADYVSMIILSIYGIVSDVRDGYKVNKNVPYVNTIKELLMCLAFAVVFSIPALLVTSNTLSLIFRGLLSSIMSFGGGDAYLTVADGMFVSTGMVTEEEFYSMLVPLVNVLPGSILCKTLSGVGYYIGLNDTGSIFRGLLVAVSGFSVSVAASCGVFSAVAGLYDKFGTLHIFTLIKKWIRPIVSGLLVNVMLSFIVQVKKIGSEFSYFLIPVAIIVIIFIVDEILIKKCKIKKEVVALLSVVLSFVICNIYTL